MVCFPGHLNGRNPHTSAQGIEIPEKSRTISSQFCFCFPFGDLDSFFSFCLRSILLSLTFRFMYGFTSSRLEMDSFWEPKVKNIGCFFSMPLAGLRFGSLPSHSCSVSLVCGAGPVAWVSDQKPIISVSKTPCSEQSCCKAGRAAALFFFCGLGFAQLQLPTYLYC